MAFLRRETSETMVSRAHSSSDLARGLDQILEDMNSVMPDDLVRLQEYMLLNLVWFYMHAHGSISI